MVKVTWTERMTVYEERWIEVPDSDIGTRNLAAELFQILFPEAEHFSHPETSAGEMRMVNVACV